MVGFERFLAKNPQDLSIMPKRSIVPDMSSSDCVNEVGRYARERQLGFMPPSDPFEVALKLTDYQEC
jgi:hypothetical protein